MEGRAATLEMTVEKIFQLRLDTEHETKICIQSRHSRGNSSCKTKAWHELDVLGRAQPASRGVKEREKMV